MSNRLADAASPYLLQHATNPVHWFEWGEAAFDEARRRDRPVLLSVGYAACHWCHVMARESFEDGATAEVMNRLFVNVKVDREERPDIDRIYMDAVQLTTGRGGWPMTVFLTPTGEPFFAGTYFPPQPRSGMPSFVQVMEAVADAWDHQRAGLEAQAGRLTAAVSRTLPPGSSAPDRTDLEAAYRAIEASYDPVHGGFGGAPKFPQPGALEFLLRVVDEPWAPRAAEMLRHTLHSMARGGIRDQLAGGFARYSVDAEWRVPHFEKMLYDNALLGRIYLETARVTGDAELESVGREILDYLLADLRLPDGGFASSEDADTEGTEGAFYTFTLAEIEAAAGRHAEMAASVFGATETGDLDGANVLRLAATEGEAAAATGVASTEAGEIMADIRRHLLETRSRRPRPALDDKAVCAWNALAIRALAEAGAALGETAYLDAAVDAARFVLRRLRREDGRLVRSWRRGRPSVPGFAEDYGAVAVALFSLYQATGDAEWYREAERTTRDMLELFWDDAAGGCFAAGRDAEPLIARPKSLTDNPTPSGNSLAAEALSLLAAATADTSLDDRIAAISRLASQVVEHAPAAAGHLLAVLHSTMNRLELAIVGDPADPRTATLIDAVRSSFRPHVFLAVGDPSDPEPAVPLLRERPAGPDGRPTAYLCRGAVCDAPTAEPGDLLRRLA